jgi:hypothetical protein
MKKTVVGLILSLFILFAVPLKAHAFTPFGTTCGGGTGGSSAVCTDSKTATTDDPIEKEIAGVTHLVAIAAGIVEIIMLFIGAIRYITAAGDANSIGSAKNTIIYAIVGLIVTVMAQSIIVFVVDRIN